MSSHLAGLPRAAPKFAGLVALGWLLSACGAPAESSEPIGESVQRMTVCPGQDLIYGVDVSVYQEDIDWPTVAASETFAIARVSDGMGKDKKFDENWAGIQSAGLIRGAYQFFEPAEDPTAQAQLMIDAMGTLGPGDLPPTLDVEVSGSQTPDTINANIHTWVDAIQSATGRTPMIYTGDWFWDPSVASGDFSDLPLWISGYGVTCPNVGAYWTQFAIWQYSGSGKVDGIPDAVDLDEFNGTMDELNLLAGINPDYGATYVSQSFPLATTAFTMTVNSDLSANMVLQNSGGLPWDSQTRLATTQPRDRVSVFAGADWIAPNRLAAPTDPVNPGDTYQFNFTFHAPDKPGTYLEYFGMVEDGTAWFSDPGEGGPADDVFEAQIEVVAADYQAKLVKQSFPAIAAAPLAMNVGDTVKGSFDLENVGTATWKAGTTKLAPTPRDKPSPLGSTDWLSPTRVSTLAADVAPGSTGHFEVDLEASKTGDFKQTFGLIEEGTTWFADAPEGGGPADDALGIHVVVSAAVASSGSGSGTGAGAEVGSTSGTPDSAGAPGDTGGCSCTSGNTTNSPLEAGFFAFAALALARLRRRDKRV